MSAAPVCRARSLSLALVALLALGGAALAGEIRVGAAMQVKPNSIWFEDEALLARWQALKTSGDEKALADFQDKALRARRLAVHQPAARQNPQSRAGEKPG